MHIGQLEFHYQKGKIIAFAEKPKRYSWMIDGHKIEQVSCFKYMGVVLNSMHSREPQEDYTVESAKRNLSAILKLTKLM